jgi:cytoskeletal protein CcmA (bactofilin family)
MKKTILLTALAALIPAFASAAPTYSMISGNFTQIGMNSTVNSGSVGSNGNVNLLGGVLVKGNVDSGNNASLGQGTTVNGNVTAAEQVSLNGSAHVGGNVDANKTSGTAVSLGQNSSVTGTITRNAGTNLSQNAGSSYGGSVVGAPTPFTSFGLPGATSFGAGGADVIRLGSQPAINLTAGSYDKINLGANNTLNFTHGDYYFNSLLVDGYNTFNFDLSGGAINLYFTGNVSIGHHLNVELNGDASGLHTETKGNWNQDGFGEWFGTLYGSGEDSNLNFGQYSTLTGSFIAAHNLTVDGNSLINLAEAPAQGNNVPEPASVLLAAAGLLGLALSRRRQR